MAISEASLFSSPPTVSGAPVYCASDNPSSEGVTGLGITNDSLNTPFNAVIPAPSTTSSDSRYTRYTAGATRMSSGTHVVLYGVLQSHGECRLCYSLFRIAHLFQTNRYDA